MDTSALMTTLPLDADRLLERAQALGFAQAALLPAHLIDTHALELWLAEARHLPLDYMQDTPRGQPELLLPDARTILVVTASYHGHASRAYGDLRIARYAHHQDYHEVLRARLQELAAFIVHETGAAVATRSATDSAPLLERALAQRAGLGWIGKNTLLIHPKWGSYCFIAELLIEADLPPHSSSSHPDRCGRCTRCLDACPTQAIVAPHLLDARRCISTWTIESSGPIPRWIRPKIGDLLFGCDICQEVCPWNHKALLSEDTALTAPDHMLELSPDKVLSLTSRQFNQIFANTALLRAGRTGLARNAAVVLGNTHDPSHHPLLRQRLATESSALVRGHIAWALGQLPHAPLTLSALRRLQEHDPSSMVREEAAWSLEQLGEALAHP